MGLNFMLTGYSVLVGSDTVVVERKISTDSATPTRWTLSLDDAIRSTTNADTPTLVEPGRFTPGSVSLTEDSAAIHVMPSAMPVAKLLLQFIREAASAPRKSEAFVAFVKSWQSANAVAQPAIRFVAPSEKTPSDNHESATSSEATSANADASVAKSSADVTTAFGAAGKPDAGKRVAGTSTEGPWTSNTTFVGFDVETANDDPGSVIQFGLAVVEDGAITKTYSWLCRPPRGLERFDEENIGIHGITAADVAGQPTFVERLQQFAEVVGNRPVVAHNAKFDFTAVARACRAEDIDAPEVAFSCTYMWSRQAQLRLPNLKLPTLAAAAGFNLENHHDASADAMACASIALWLMSRYSTDSVDGLNQALSMRPGILSGRSFSPIRWDPYVNALPFDASTDGADSNGANGSSSGSNGGSGTNNSNGSWRTRRNTKWDAAKTPAKIPAPNPDADPNGLLFGQRVTLTGDFAPFDKGYLWDKLADAGAHINKGVTKKTTILVAGPWDSVTTKEKRARELQEQGQEIEIWNENELFNALGLNPNSIDEEAQ